MPAGKPESLGADLSAYLDGELPQERAAQIERELSESPELREELEQLRAVSSALAGLPRVTPPSELQKRLLQAARKRRPGAGPTRLLRWSMRLTAAAAVIGGAVLVGWEALRDTHPGGRPARQFAVAQPRAGEPPKETAPIQAPARDSNDLAGGLSSGTGAEKHSAARGASEPGSLAGRAELPAGLADSAAAAPVLAIYLEPRTPDEFAAAAEALSEWRRVPAYDAWALGGAESADEGSARALSRERDVTVGALLFQGDLRATEVASVVTGLESRTTAPLYVEADSPHGPTVVWCSGNSAVAETRRIMPAPPRARPEGLAQPAVGHLRATAATPTSANRDPERARPSRVAARKSRGDEAMASRVEKGIMAEAASASAPASQSQPASAPQSAPAAEPSVLSAVTAWLNNLPGHSRDGQDAVRVWIRLVPPAPEENQP